MASSPNRRILVVDDVPAIREDFRKLLSLGPAGCGRTADLDAMEATLFGVTATVKAEEFELDFASQGQEALSKVEAALAAGRPYATAFVDMRMPPGWDGVETIERVWQVDPRVQMVICTAYSDHSWAQILQRLDVGDRLLILKKPFDPIEVCQLAATLTAKWQATILADTKMRQLTQVVEDRTAQLRAANQALLEDLAERKRAAAELALGASVFRHALDGIVITGPLGRVMSVNPAFTAITGYQPEEVLGWPVTRLWRRSGTSGSYDIMRNSLARDGRWEGEIRSRKGNGEPLFVRLSVARVREDEVPNARYVCIFNDVTDMRRKDEYIRHLAFHDHLTGLPNQALLFDRINEGITHASGDRAPLGIMYIDLDRFKAVNDSFGHDVGNSLLQEVAARLRGCLRRSDTVARIGGDEFVVLLRRIVDPSGYAALAQKVIAQLSTPVHVAGRDMQVGASIGIACYPDDGSDSIELMKNADAAMYAAKSGGRGAYRFFKAAMTARAEERLQLEMELRAAVRDGDLEMYYQPKVMLPTGAMCGVEALVRWRHRGRGLLSPNAFIALAEETGIIRDLGDWVLAEVFRQSRAWRRSGVGGFRIAVNISAEQLRRDDLVEKIITLASRYSVAPSDIEIELTESGVMADPEAVSEVLGRLRLLGIPIAIDDFGTGYSSLAYLRRLPIDILKIDRSFVANADQGRSDAEIVKTVVALGQALGLTVVAEGVETESQADYLRSCGCPAAQGYLFAEPLPADQMELWLRRASEEQRVRVPGRG
jgi:diguanylate cyclase (GGDEF)-like protein/PAS domain S-box-containing protein